ncbi:Uma2 family endonuclease [Alienimonas chondri]|uniref:Putative restriction endonuclease domain-containing protein n=1 Tax=Alienimonas chondri TaxID=2681879 RepID=A0ABX1VGU8_9PLAN|nr:Uma2 family endonuclease [Alienimonas chondri]NNJ27354.1 hypothetical protein [Alienimonas chondri]
MPQLAEPPPRPAPPARRTVLRGVTWAEYVALRAKPENEHVKLTYDGPAGGLLEIEMPNGPLHENVSWWLANLILAFTEERRIPVRGVGSLTQSREDLQRGLESDLCYYVSSLPKLEGRDAVDLEAGDPPPDLCVEVDVTSPGVRKLPIYAALGVPEVWVWANDTLTVHRRGDDGAYAVSGKSGELPGFPIATAAALIARRAEAEHFALLAEWRTAVRPDENQ